MVDLKNIKPQNLWYVVGLITTDGCLSKDGRHIDITSKNRKHLEAVKDALGLKVKIGLKTSGGNLMYPRLQFGDVNFYRFLENIGLSKKKSLVLREIDINGKYFRDFLRGVIDGDGSICTWIHKSNFHRQWSLRIVSAAPIFINWLKRRVEEKYGVRGRVHAYIRDGRNNLYLLKFGKLAAKVIISDIYYKDSLALGGKDKKHTRCLQDENKMINYGGVISSGAETGNQDGLKIR